MNTGSKVLLGVVIGVIGVFAASLWKADSRTDSEIALMDSNLIVVDQWFEFIAPNGEFKVMVPSAPQYLEEGIDIPNSNTKRRYEVYAAEEADGTVYLITIITYPSNYTIDSPQKLMEEVIHEMLDTRVSNHLVNAVETRFQGYPARSFTIDNADITVKGTAFVKKHSVFVLAYLSMDSNLNKSEFEEFINSFQFLSNR